MYLSNKSDHRELPAWGVPSKLDSTNTCSFDHFITKTDAGHW
jgi:hypothetical protein